MMLIAAYRKRDAYTYQRVLIEQRRQRVSDFVVLFREEKTHIREHFLHDYI
jgi:hypothetical protein